MLTLIISFVFLGLVSVSVYADEPFVIGVGDTLTISVWEDEKLNGVLMVLPDGTISMPLLGNFRAAGYTCAALANHIATKLNSVFRKKPLVTVAIQGMGNYFFYIIGSVNKPGPTPFTHNIRLLEAIALSGGVTMDANEDSVVLVRNNRTRTISIEKLDKGKDLSNNIRIKPQDIIIVPAKTEQIYLMGEVSSPGAYYFNKNMTVMQALIQAHGLTQFASSGSIRIIRRLKNGDKKIIHIDLNHIQNEKKAEPKEFLKPDDLIYVPERMF
ncbi:MAG: polysaccharide biosynthesis/export family protein [Leptospirales bacterium]